MRGIIGFFIGLAIPMLLALFFIPHSWPAVLGAMIGIWSTTARALRQRKERP